MIYEVMNWISGYLYDSFLFFSFLYAKPIQKHKLGVSIFLICSIGIQLCIGVIFDFDLVAKLYPFVVHIALVLFTILFLKKSITSSLCAILIAYILMAPRNWIGDLFVLIVPAVTYVKDITIFIVTLPLFLLFVYFLSPHIRNVIQQASKFLQLIIVPGMLYYCIAYFTTVYTNILYHSNIAVIELLLLLCTIAVFVYVWIAFQQLSKTMVLEQQQKLMHLQAEETMKHMEEIRYSQEKTKIMRHDLRHYFQIIDSMIVEGKSEEVRDYIRTLTTEINETVVRQYCLNESINLILSSYAGKSSKSGVQFSITSNVISILDQSKELDICIVLANAIENALHAVVSLTNPWIAVDCNTFQEKIVMQIKNPYQEQPKFKNGLP